RRSLRGRSRGRWRWGLTVPFFCYVLQRNGSGCRIRRRSRGRLLATGGKSQHCQRNHGDTIEGKAEDIVMHVGHVEELRPGRLRELISPKAIGNGIRTSIGPTNRGRRSTVAIVRGEPEKIDVT